MSSVSHKRAKRGLGLNLVLSFSSSSSSSSPTAPPPVRGPSIVRFTQPDDELHKALQRQSPSAPRDETAAFYADADMDERKEMEEEAKRLPTAAYIAARVRKARESVLPIPQLFSRRVTSVVEALTMRRFRTLSQQPMMKKSCINILNSFITSLNEQRRCVSGSVT